jgi:hypothetical protein
LSPVLLIVIIRIPIKTRADSKKIEILIPNAGIIMPEINIKPNADPARSAL